MLTSQDKVRPAIPLMIAILVFGCGGAPPTEQVANQAKEQLQGKIKTVNVLGKPTVLAVKVVPLAAPKFDGEATITAYGLTFTIPVSVTSDGKTTLVAVDDEKLSADIALAMHRRLATLEGKYSDSITSPDVFGFLPSSLQAAKADFVARLQTIGPIESDGDYYVGSGCAPHQCTSDEAVWAIDKSAGKGSAVIMKYIPERPAMAAHENFQLYGATIDSLPPPLAAWASERGITEANSVPDVPQYQPPPK